MAFDAGTIEATLDLDRGPFRTGLAEARKEAEAFEKRGIKLKVDVDKSFTNQIQRAINETQSKTGRGIRIPIDIDDREIDDFKKKLDRIGDSTETTARRSGNRVARALLNPLVLQLGLLPGITAAAAAAGGLALGALPLAMGAIGIAALKNNEIVKEAYADLWQNVKTEAEGIAQPLEETFTHVADKIYASWRSLQPELAAMFRDTGPLIETFADGVLGAAEEAVPRFRTAIQLSGPAMRGFSSLIRDLGAGVGEMTVEIAHSSNDVGRSTELVGEMVRGLLQNIGQLIALFAGAWAEIGPKFNRVFDTMMQGIVNFTEGGLRGLTDGLNVTLSVVEGVLNVISPFADILGQVAGYALSAAAGWKILAGAIGLGAKAWSLISPAQWVGKMSGVSKVLDNVAMSAGNMVGKLGGSQAAVDRTTNVVSKMGNAVVKTAGALPLLGTALAVGKAAIDHFWPSADVLAEKIAQGGAAAAEAHDQMYDVGKGYNQGSMWAQTFAATTDEVNAALKAQRANMTELERAQADAEKAQNNYTYAVDKFGKNSPQARSAQLDLASATDDVERAQHDAADATQDHTDKIIAQTNIMLGAVGARLGYQGSLLSMEEAQKNLTDAIAQHGVGSLEARQADVAYQQSILQVVNSLGQRVAAENAAKGETEANKLATIAMHQEIARLAVAAGEDLPPALAEMAGKLTDAELAAMGVTKEVDGTGQAIYRLPPGKTLAFPNDAPVAEQSVRSLKGAIDAIKPSKWINFYLNYVVTGDTAAAKNPDFGGGLGLIGAPPRAEGGPVRQGMAYWVGEKGIPELFFPNTDGFVLNGRDSQRVSSTQTGTTATPAMLPLGNDGGSAPDLDQLIEAIERAFANVLRDAKLEIEGDQWARVVNRANLRNGAR